MKTTFIITVLILFTCTIMPVTALSGEMDHGKMKMDHSKMNMDHSKMNMDQNNTEKKIHTSNKGDYTFDYQLIDMAEKMKNMPGMGKMTATHHLMLNITGSGDIENAKVGFVITDPEGKKTNAMAMGMNSGFGADINMMKKGEYKIKTKFMLGEKKLLDEFTYHAK